MSNGVYDDLATTPVLTETMRLLGTDRFAISLAINDQIVDTAFDDSLPTGTGFADALAGAALAGKNFAPLYTLPRTCIPMVCSRTSVTSKSTSSLCSAVRSC